MPASFDHAASANYSVSYCDDRELCTRVEAEFVEMPGLRLTLAQAVRLFNIAPAQCERVLGTLVLAGHLASDGNAFASPRIGRRSV